MTIINSGFSLYQEFNIEAALQVGQGSEPPNGGWLRPQTTSSRSRSGNRVLPQSPFTTSVSAVHATPKENSQFLIRSTATV